MPIHIDEVVAEVAPPPAPASEAAPAGESGPAAKPDDLARVLAELAWREERCHAD
jgi:hypothetical protein